VVPRAAFDVLDDWGGDRTLGMRASGSKPILPTALQRLLQLSPCAVAQGGADALSIPPEQLRHAIGVGQITAWFRPQTSLETGLVVGAEALARWRLPDGRWIPPSTFVRIAEQGGMAAALTDLMLDRSLRACSGWRDKRPDCWVSVNVSPLLLDDPGIADRIKQKLRKHGVTPGVLIVEITATNGIPDTPTNGIPDTPCAMEILTRLRIRGVNLAVDDFGTGHSSLLSLVRMPFNEMKIDPAFVADAISNRDARKVVRASASLGRELGLKVVAEGVETEAMARLVQDAGCQVGQGWLYGRAVPPEIFQANLEPSPEIAGVEPLT
jgi:EAL domain-containing protein (putative c-di-GMP-specific phosphodiesterase class I)